MGIQVNHKKKEVWQTSHAGEETKARGGRAEQKGKEKTRHLYLQSPALTLQLLAM